MKQRARWIIVVAVVGALVAYNLVIGSAQEPESLRRLVLENRVAEAIADLNLTAEQKEQLKEVAEKYRSAWSASSTELARLLAERRDALLEGDREAVSKVEEELKSLLRENPLTSDKSVREFISGLTERQKQVLASILPGITGGEVRSTRMGPWRIMAWRIPMPDLPGLRERFEWPDWPSHDMRPQILHRLPERNVRSFGMAGYNSEVIDVLIDLLDR